jgi:hypothetical protein
MARPVPGANHVSWQLGHLISADCRLVDAGVQGSIRFGEIGVRASAAVREVCGP